MRSGAVGLWLKAAENDANLIRINHLPVWIEAGAGCEIASAGQKQKIDPVAFELT